MRRSTRNFNTPPPPSWAFELLKSGSFKFSPPRAKMVFKFPTLSSDLSFIPYQRTIVVGSCRLYKDLLMTFFVSQSLTNATSLPLNSSISSKRLFCSCYRLRRPKKKNHLKPNTSGSIFPTPRRQRSNSPLPGHR